MLWFLSLYLLCILYRFMLYDYHRSLHKILHKSILSWQVWMHKKALDFILLDFHNYIFHITIYVVVYCVSIKVSWSGSLQFVLFTIFWASWIWMSISFPRLVKYLSIISLNKPSAFFSLFSFWDPYNAYIGPFDGVP